MKESIMKPKLILEEKKAAILFLWLFNVMYISYDIFYNFIFPYYSKEGKVGLPSGGLGFWIYILIYSLLPISIYYMKKGNPYIVKYIYIAGYFMISFVNYIMEYRHGGSFHDGNIVEVLFFLFSPIFVNKRYLWSIFTSLVGLYVFFGIFLKDPIVLAPIIIFIILSAISYILLIRFNSYINALTAVHEELRQKEKLAVIGQMATAIGHEIRNPLSSLKGFAQLQKETYPNTNDYFQIMIQEIDRINSIVSDLMYLGKPRTIKFEKANIEEIITYTLSITKQQAERQGVVVETVAEKPISPLDCDEKQLKQIFINIIKNAIEAMIEGGKITINLKIISNSNIYISVEDEGPGIAQEYINNIGEPYFTTKINGTGLGLMVTSQIIKEHHGDLKIENNPTKGAKVIVTLPIFQQK